MKSIHYYEMRKRETINNITNSNNVIMKITIGTTQTKRDYLHSITKILKVLLQYKFLNLK